MIREKVNTKTSEVVFTIGGDSTNMVMKDSTGDYIATKDNYRITQKFDDITKFNFGLAVFTLRGKQGAVDRDGSIVIEAKYQKIVFDSKLYRFRENGKWGFMNSSMKVICKPKYTFIELFKNKKYARVMEVGGWGAISRNGKIVFPSRYTYLDDVNDSIFVAGYFDTFGAIDIHGNEKDPFKYSRASICKEAIDKLD